MRSMAFTRTLLAIWTFLVVTLLPFNAFATESSKGKWELLRRSVGISAMHVALLPNDKIIAFDRTDFGPSNISLSLGRCRADPNDQALPYDCYAHSVEFDASTRIVRPLTVLTDTWCSSGALSSDGILIQTGGFNDGDRAVRYLSPCDGCDWDEQPQGLAVRRWYATNHILPDERIIVVGGRGQFNYEFIPKDSNSGSSVFDLRFLRETKDGSENNLYPFVHLLPDGNLFIFANTKAILLDYVNNKEVRKYPEMPGGAARNYPSSGSSVLLPILLHQNDTNPKAEVMVCGGANPASNSMAMKGVFLAATNTCGRLVATDESPEWEMEEMPMNRVMGDMVLLPTGDLLIINGAGNGSAGWCVGREPVLHPVLYRTGVACNNDAPSFEIMTPTAIPRLYHSTAHLLSDGRVLVGGSNPNIKYEFSGVLFPTELSIEAFSPPYLFQGPRPEIVVIAPGLKLGYGQRFTIGFKATADKGGLGLSDVRVTMVSPAFTTHSFSMNQRLLVVKVVALSRVSDGRYAVDGFTPATAALAPPGYYILHVVHGGVPSRGKWVRIKQ